MPEPQACNFIKKETPTQVLSCEFSEIFTNTFFASDCFSKYESLLLYDSGRPQLSNKKLF